MRPRPDPNSESFTSLYKRLSRTARVQSAVAKLQEDPEASVADLSAHEQTVIYAEIERIRFGSVADSHYDRAWRETTQVAAAPQRDDRIRDLLGPQLGQPEMQAMWREWTGAHGTRSSTPEFAYAKALMIFNAAAGMSNHINAQQSLFDVATDLHRFFAAYDHQAKLHQAPPLPGMVEHLQSPPLRTYSYPQARVHMKRLARPGTVAAWRANIEMLKALREYFPVVGQRVMIDGTAYPSWSRQVWGGKRGSPVDRKLRGRDDDAGFRAYGYGPNGKFDIDDDSGTFKLFRAGRAKSWRGYYWVVLVDQATALPIIATLQDASINEYFATERLLLKLHQLWPDIGIERLIADAGWDWEDQHRLILTKFGAQPIFRAGANAADKAIPPTGKSDRALAITAQGEVLCPHGKCAHVGMPAVPRDGLKPGEEVKHQKFIVRVNCPLEAERAAALKAGDRRRERELATESCGKLSVRAEHSWRRLAHLPHHPLGRPDLYAERQVLIARLSGVESFIGRIKSLGLANPGAARSRVGLLMEHESYMALGSAALTALALADQRQRRGITFHSHPGGIQPPTPREHAQQLAEQRPNTLVVGNDDSPAARRAGFRVLPGGLT